MYHGILPVLKPKGYTSHDVVRYVRQLVGQRRVGHAGTLDPDVEGVLLVCLGQATRLVEYLQELPKKYQGTLTLGIATDTEDQSGTVLARQPVSSLDQVEVRRVFKQFTGEIEQIPPMYSAVKQQGRRLYELARKGQVVKRPPRKVQIYQLDLLAIHPETYPQIQFSVCCSKGTYIRTLCVDIGRKLGCPAHMSQLIRTTSGPFHLEDCFTLAEIEAAAKEDGWNQVLSSLDEGLGHLPSLIIEKGHQQRVWDGWEIYTDIKPSRSTLVRVYSEQGEFYALYRLEPTGFAKAEKVFREVNRDENH